LRLAGQPGQLAREPAKVAVHSADALADRLTSLASNDAITRLSFPRPDGRSLCRSNAA
jgi:hypothetical protein